MTSNSIYSILLPIYSITQLVGLVPFYINKRTSERSFIRVIWAILCMLAVNAGLVLIKPEDEDHSGFTATATRFLYDSTSHLGTWFQIVCSWIYINDTIDLLSFFERFDLNMKQLLGIDLNAEYTKTKKYARMFVVLLIGLIVLMAIGILLDYVLYEEASVGNVIYYIISPLLNTFLILQFCSLVMCFRQRFKWLNDKIEASSKTVAIQVNEYTPLALSANQHTKAEPSVITVVTDLFHEKVITVLQEIRRKHYQLCENTQKLNEIYLAQNFIIIFQDFITIIKCLYYCSKISISTDHTPIDFVAYLAVIFIIAVAHILILVSCCSKTMSEAQNAGPLIHKLLSSNPTLKEKNKEELQLEVSFFSLQLLHQRAEFTVVGMFPIDETLIFSMVGVTTTYLIIIIQFELQ